MKRLRSFGRFWYDFLVGDDWTIAVAVIPAVGITAALAQTGHPAWYVMPVAVVVILGVSMYRAATARR